MAFADAAETGRNTNQGFDDTDSEAIKSFDEKFSQAREEIHALNPIEGCIAGDNWKDAPLSSTYMESLNVEEWDKRDRVLQGFLKSAVVNMMVVFEGYVHDIVTEAFTYTFWDHTYLDDRPKLRARQECEVSWPAVKNLVTKKMTNLTKNNEEKKTELFTIIKDQDVWQYLISKHMDETLGDLGPTITKMRTTLTRLFYLDDKTETINLLPKEDHSLCSKKTQDRAIDKLDAKKKVPGQQKGTPKKTVEKEENTSLHLDEFPLEIMVKNKAFSTQWMLMGACNALYDTTVVIEDIVPLTHILDLFYAIRCISVHGKSQPTIDGVLKNFPKGQDRTLNLGKHAVHVENYLFEIYDSIVANNLKVNYVLCINVSRFIKNVAISLQRALGYFIYYQLKFERMHGSFFSKNNKFWGLKKYGGGIMDVPWGGEKIEEMKTAAVAQ